MCGVTRVFSGGNTPGFISILITGGNEHGTLVTEEWTLGARQVEIIENFFECRRSDAIPALDAIAGQVHFDRRQYARAQPNQKPVVTKKTAAPKVHDVQYHFAAKGEAPQTILDIIEDLLSTAHWADAAFAMDEHQIRSFRDFDLSCVQGILTLYRGGSPVIAIDIRKQNNNTVEKIAARVFNAAGIMRPVMEKIYDLVTWDTVKREAHEERIARNALPPRPLTYKQRQTMLADRRARSIEHQIDAPSLVAAFAMPTSLDRSYHDQVAVGRPIALKLA